MAISNLQSDWASAQKQRLPWKKTTTRTTVALGWFSLFDIAGVPGAGTLAAGNTANGLVPTDAIAGYPIINNFSGSGYIGRSVFANTVLSRIRLYDRLFVCGAYAFNANTNLATQPSFSARCPGGLFNGLELWVEQVTTATGNQAVNVTYIDQGGASSSTGAVGIAAAPTVGRCWQLPLASGDSGLQRIDNVTGSVASAGTFNVMVLRPLDSERIAIANAQMLHDVLATGLPEMYQDSALYCMVNADSTSSGLPDCEFDVVSK